MFDYHTVTIDGMSILGIRNWDEANDIKAKTLGIDGLEEESVRSRAMEYRFRVDADYLLVVESRK